MKSNSYCSQCAHKESCREVYRRLGQYEGPSVTWAVIRAFLIPIVVFISSLAAVQWLLRGYLSDKALLGASFAAGVGVTLMFIIGMRALGRRFAKKC